MKSVRFVLIVTFVLAAVIFAAAQEGHPLTGTWYGDFGMTPAQRNDLTVVMKWDGANISGVVNPGPGMVPIKSAQMDVKLGKPAQRGARGEAGTPATPSTFLVHFEVDAKNKAGGMDHFVFDGHIENPVAGNRQIIGTWTCGSTKGDFRLRRL
ncbi:MAG TPA: hypothetical protein VKY31_12535 [Terriglobia bacterium]|nr:hypothetical protein [Terriglobia bacterium]